MNTKEKDIFWLLMLADNYACAEKEVTRKVRDQEPKREYDAAVAFSIIERSKLEKELRKVL